MFHKPPFCPPPCQPLPTWNHSLLCSDLSRGPLSHEPCRAAPPHLSPPGPWVPRLPGTAPRMVFSAKLLSCCRSWQGDRRPARRGDHHGGEGEGGGVPRMAGGLHVGPGCEAGVGGPCILPVWSRGGGVPASCRAWAASVDLVSSRDGWFILPNTQSTPSTTGDLPCLRLLGSPAVPPYTKSKLTKYMMGGADQYLGGVAGPATQRLPDSSSSLSPSAPALPPRP